jgi:hypothetical protein
MANTDILLAPATIYRSATGVALPDETAVAYGAAWGEGWTNLGYTLQPLSVNLEVQKLRVFVEQLTNAVKSKITEKTLMFESVLAEFTGDNVAMAFGGTNEDTPAAVGQVGFSEVNMGGETGQTTYQWGFEGFLQLDNGVQLPVRIFLYRGTCTMNGQLQFSKAAAVGIPIQIESEADTSKATGSQLIKIQIVTSEALGS